jgi:choice-of-anchor A domain-containing protein
VSLEISMFTPFLHRGLTRLATVAGASALLAAPAAHASTFMDTLANVSQTYNAYTSGSFSSSNTDSEGRIAAGGSVSLSSYSVAEKNKGGDALVAGGAVSFNSGTIYGNSISAGAASYSGANVTGKVSAGGPVGGSSAPYLSKATYTNLPFDFTSTSADLAAASAYLGSSAAQSQGVKGSVVLNYSTLTFTSDATSGLVFFDVTAAQLANINLRFDVSSLATVIVNVTGQQANGTAIGAQGFDGVTAGKTLFNFEDATHLNLGNFYGSILATDADVTTGWGHIDGALMAKSYSGNDQLNWRAFKGDLPTLDSPPAAIPEPASWAMMILGVGAVGAVLRHRRRLARDEAPASA